MKISCLTLFPELIQNYLESGFLKKAIDKSIMEINVINLREYSLKSYKTIDDRVYGGGDGTLFQYEILKKALLEIRQINTEAQVIYLSPQGKSLNTNILNELKNQKHLILVSGRYAGIDQRFIKKYVDIEISIGDYVLNGGELPSLVLIESLTRFLPGVLGNAASIKADSFASEVGGLLEAPQFTRPQMIDDLHVPQVLTSGDHSQILVWQKYVSFLVTLKKRPDLISHKIEKWTSKFIKQVIHFYESTTDADIQLLQIENLNDDLNKLLESIINDEA